MIGMDILGIAQQGLQQAETQFNRAAQQVAHTSLNGGPSQPPADSVSLSDSVVSLLNSKDQYQAEIGVAHTAAEMQKATLSLLA